MLININISFDYVVILREISIVMRYYLNLMTFFFLPFFAKSVLRGHYTVLVLADISGESFVRDDSYSIQ